MSDPSPLSDTVHSDSPAEFTGSIKEPAPLPECIGRYRVQKVLGEGGYGIVYLAFDEQLDRQVAIKVPHSRLVAQRENAQSYLAEARLLASLEHPHIVAVHDVGTSEQFPCYVVSRYVDGVDLASHIARGRPDQRDAAQLVAAVAEALHAAHRKGLVHRDVKPGNILLDHAGKPFLVDFGLALREQELGQGPRFAGTPAYMSPEQARGEGHRVDGRSDIFSLGAVFYELLTGRRPFQGANQFELLEQIVTHEPKPPRQIDDRISRELERICLKALAKRVADRFTTAKDLADDLRQWLAQGEPLAPVNESRPAPVAEAAPLSAPTTARTDSRPLAIAPKGLRPFDEHDSEFFLELLPGPRDRGGLPQSVRFWKTRIEQRDPEQTFAVGLLYGPSGCGKSSLLRAGILPRLSGSINALYVEATAGGAEARLKQLLGKRWPELAALPGLKEMLFQVRRGAGPPPGAKLLIVIDQFEQWLHARTEDEQQELVEALRQADGERVQCLLLVRDDFWMSITRFLARLEIDLVQGNNFSSVDLFTPKHARKVLAAFGRAHGDLPESAAPLSEEQKRFIDEAVSGLAESGQVVCVRLALFAQMMKGKPWTSAALKGVGGAAGLGVAFLEELFGSHAANPRHRVHERAARAVLQSLLSGGNVGIRGALRTDSELLEVSGYAARPRDFEDLLRLLDAELRLITPADEPSPCEPAAGGVQQPAQPPPGAQRDPPQRHYQLTHDFLVPPLREWLMRKQKATRVGRAQLRLADCAALWQARPDARHLPSFWEFLKIRLLTPRHRWSTSERNVMRAARSRHARRAGVVLLLLLVVGLAGQVILENFEDRRRRDEARLLLDARREQARLLVDQLLSADTRRVDPVLAELEAYRPWTGLWLNEQAFAAAEADAKIHLGLALLPEPRAADYLHARLLDARPEQVAVVLGALSRAGVLDRDRLWRQAGNSSLQPGVRIQAAAALAQSAAADQLAQERPQWTAIAEFVATHLVSLESSRFVAWRDLLLPSAGVLIEPLERIYRNGSAGEAARLRAAEALAIYAAGDAERLFELLAAAERFQYDVIYPALEKTPDLALAMANERVARPRAVPGGNGDHDARHRANAAVVLFRREAAQAVWPLLARTPDPTFRSHVVDVLAELGVKPALLADRLVSEADPGVRQAIILALGNYQRGAIEQDLRQRLIEVLSGIHATDPDAGLHAAAEWTLARWNENARLDELRQRAREADRPLLARPASFNRSWYVNGLGQTYAILGPATFSIGSSETDPDREPGENQHRRDIPYRFAICTTEVTKLQFERFQRANSPENPTSNGKEHVFAVTRDARYERYMGKHPDAAVGSIVWSEAAQFCNWLSGEEGIAESEWCYEPNADGQYGPGMRARPGFLKLTGYRLPTEPEWEFACRAGAATSRFFGSSERLLARYAVFGENAQNRTRPVASLKPNDFGLFDMLGNVTEWCHESNYKYPDDGAFPTGRDPSDDVAPAEINIPRLVRGGSYTNQPWAVRSAVRYSAAPYVRERRFGFRPARTIAGSSTVVTAR